MLIDCLFSLGFDKYSPVQPDASLVVFTHIAAVAAFTKSYTKVWFFFYFFLLSFACSATGFDRQDPVRLVWVVLVCLICEVGLCYSGPDSHYLLFWLWEKMGRRVNMTEMDGMSS
jgi:hypothetical protein